MKKIRIICVITGKKMLELSGSWAGQTYATLLEANYLRNYDQVKVFESTDNFKTSLCIGVFTKS